MFRKFKNIFENSQGFTLIEIVVIIVVLAIAIPSIMTLLSSLLTDSSKYEIITQAATYAQEKIDEIIADKRSSDRGYNWVVTTGRYQSDVPASGFIRSVYIDTTAKVYNGVPYALLQVQVQAGHIDIPNIELTTWLTDY